MKTLTILLGEHPCIVNILFGPMTVHYREVLLYYENKINYFFEKVEPSVLVQVYYQND